jgi:prolyl-tRNA synthetase
VHVVITGKAGDDISVAGEQLAQELHRAGVTVLLDDRIGVSPGVKFKDAELLGMPTIVVVGKGLLDGVVEVRDRATGERSNVAVAEAAQHIAHICKSGS